MVERLRMSEAPLILLVDDQPSNLVLLQQMVRWVGYRTCEAQTGQQALELVETAQPDVVVLDILLPDMDGFSVLRAIRDNPTLSYIPVIMITAQEQASARQRAYIEGADDFLLKPIESETLRARLRVAVHLKRTLSRVEMERERFAFIASLSRELGQIDSLMDMLEHIVTVCTNTLHAHHGNLIVLRETGEHVDVLTASHQVRLNIDDVHRVLAHGAAGHVIKTGKSLCIDNIQTDPHWLQIEGSTVSQGSALLVPLGDIEDPLGVLAIYHNQICYFTPEDQDLLELVARQITGLLRQARLRDEQNVLTQQLQQQARQLRLVNSLAQTLSGNLDLPMLYEAINQQMRLLLGDVATGWFAINDDVSMAYSSVAQSIQSPLDAATLKTVLEMAQLERTTRVALNSLPPISIVAQLLGSEYSGAIAVPLHHQGTTLGILMIAVRQRQFTKEEESLLEMARPHLAVAMATAQTIADREARQAEQAELVHLRHMAELAGQMAHHFNNLFAAILGNTQLAELDAVNEDQQMLLATVVEQVRDGAAMIRRLHLLKGGERIPPSFALDLAETMPVILDHLEHTNAIPHITNLDIPAGLMILVHERELITLCSELISNALEAGADPQQIHIRAWDTKHYVAMAISDSGHGIDEQQLNSIWRPFWTTHGPQRLGLGLPICSAVMWRMGGRINITTNAPAPGMTVTLQFPNATGASA